MARVAIEHFLVLLNESFDGDGAHSLLGNVRDVNAGDWDWAPPGGDRTVRSILEHVAIATHLFAEHTFGAAIRNYARAAEESPVRTRPTDNDALVAWLRAGHEAFVAGVSAMDDADLDAPTRKHHGELTTKAGAIRTIIQHDCYHAGEINHLRALREGDDVVDAALTVD